MHGYDVVTTDDHKIGTVVDERDDCLIVEHGHVFKARHAIPRSFVHVDGDAHVVRATITKDVFSGSPKVGDDWDCELVLRHYGVVGTFEVDPDPEHPATITTDDHVPERVALREGQEASTDMPRVRERQPHAADPAGETSNMS